MALWLCATHSTVRASELELAGTCWLGQVSQGERGLWREEATPWGGTEQHSNPETRSENGRISIENEKEDWEWGKEMGLKFSFFLVLLKKCETDHSI